MITMTEFIEKVGAITGQQMDNTKANQLCRLYAMIYDRGKNTGHNICVAKACDLLRDLDVFTEDFINDFRKVMKGG
jgi:hypothetical protein